MAGNASCNYCKTQIEIPDGYNRPFIPCPQCKRMVTVAASPRPAGPPPARPAAPHAPPPPPRDTTPSFTSSAMGGPAHPPPPPPPPAGAPGGDDVLPEVMKANKKVLGKSCGVCGKPIALGEQIHNCPACRSVNHDTCWTRSGGCTSPSCASSRPGHTAAGGPGFPPGQMAGGPAVPPPPGGTVPCRWCKEPIARGARKCKHCNEYQSDEDRATLGGAGKPAAGVDDVALSVTDWLGVVCCPIIALIQGLVYVAQGNPKGQRLILYSIISIGINGVIQALGGKH